MDEQTATEAMDNFTAIWNTYTLEVSNVRQPTEVFNHLSAAQLTAAGETFMLFKLQRGAGHKHRVKGLQRTTALVI